ncbi:protein of unknown function [Legionella hackeliae]|uniref:Uncharacterized protein n=1 Tax=Legionella hackeliae TaxID=449 RepID=A0A0A8UZB7_LEGHA|nr:protein of unknown function [Legionella hackeliae]
MQLRIISHTILAICSTLGYNQITCGLFASWLETVFFVKIPPLVVQSSELARGITLSVSLLVATASVCLILFGK